MSPHMSSALTTCLCAWGGAAATGGHEGRNCTGVGGSDGGGGGMIMSLNSF